MGFLILLLSFSIFIYHLSFIHRANRLLYRVTHEKWGYVKENVFKRQPADIEILKEIVQEVVSSIDQDVLRAVMANFEKRINLCIDQQGGHFEHLL